MTINFMLDDDNDEFDYGPDHAPKATNEAIAAIHQEIQKAVAASKRAEELEKALKDCKKRLQQITEETIPRMMEDNGLTEITTPDGVKVAIDNKLWASIPSYTAINRERDSERRRELIERREAAIKWLEDNDHDSLVKRSFEVQFGKGQKDRADAFRKEMLERNDDLHYAEGLDVNANSLSALVRELHRESKVFPWEVLGVAEKKTATVKFTARSSF